MLLEYFTVVFGLCLCENSWVFGLEFVRRGCGWLSILGCAGSRFRLFGLFA